MSQDLWSKLEIQFEELEARPVEVPEQLSPAPKKNTWKENLAKSHLNGFLPTVFVCSLGFYLTGIVEGNESGFGAEVLLLPVLAWLLRPLVFRGTKPSNGFLLLVPLVLGGLTEMTGVATQLCGGWARSELRYFDEYMFLHVFQDHLEGYLSFSHLAAYLLAGVLLLVTYRRIERSYYWLDLKPTNKARVGLAHLLAYVLPSLALICWGFLLWQHPWTEREDAWLEEMRDITAAMPVESFERPSEILETREFGGNIQTMQPPPNPRLEKEESLRREKDTLSKLARLLDDPHASKEEILKTKKLMKDMAEYPDNLKDPSRWALASLQLPIEHDNYTPYTVRKLLIEATLSEMATAPLDELEKKETPWSLDATLARLQDPKPAEYGIHRYLITQMGWQTHMTKPEFAEQSTRPMRLRPLTLFGRNFHTTPLKVYSRWRARPVLTWWLDFKASHQYATRAELAKLVLEEQKKSTTPDTAFLGAAIVYQETERTRSRELIELALLILELRKAKRDLGEWLEDWQPLAEVHGLALPTARIRFNPKTAELHYDQEQFWPHSTITWKLQ